MVCWQSNSLVIIDMKMMFKYSAIKISANSVPPYSVLKPETNSLSPSGRSYGLRFVSATLVLYQIKARRGIEAIILDELRLFTISVIFSDFNDIKAEMRIRAMLIS